MLNTKSLLTASQLARVIGANPIPPFPSKVRLQSGPRSPSSEPYASATRPLPRLASAVMSLSGGKGVQGRGEKSQESPGERKLDPGGVGDRDGDWNWNRGQGKRGKEDAPPNQPTFDDAGRGWGCVLCPSRCTPPPNRPTTSRPSRS